MTDEIEPIIRLDRFFGDIGKAVIIVKTPGVDRARRIIDYTTELSRQGGLKCGSEGGEPFIHQGTSATSMAHAFEHQLVYKYQAPAGVCIPQTDRPLDEPGERQYLVSLSGWLNGNRSPLEREEFEQVIYEFNQL